VIATAIGAPPETVLAPPAVAEGAATGWLVPPGDVDALAQRLALALTLPAEQRSQMGARGRAHVLRHFTVAAMQRRTLAVYDRLLATSLERRFVEASAQSVDPNPRQS
jgi:glycosyltransferase involved in cell wall biosynthesis